MVAAFAETCLQRLVLLVSLIGLDCTGERVVRVVADEQEQPTQGHPAAVQVEQVNALIRKTSLDRVTVGTDQSDEA